MVRTLPKIQNNSRPAGGGRWNPVGVGGYNGNVSLLVDKWTLKVLRDSRNNVISPVTVGAKSGHFPRIQLQQDLIVFLVISEVSSLTGQTFLSAFCTEV